jgi:hypothetical protein
MAQTRSAEATPAPGESGQMRVPVGQVVPGGMLASKEATAEDQS